MASDGLPRVAAVILNWNGAHLLPDCLTSLKGQDYTNLEVVVADNGSGDDSRAVAAAEGVRFLAFGKNLGFAGGNNAAAGRIEADFVLFVNNDMRFDSGFVSALLARAAADSEVFACDAMQMDWEGARRVHGANRLRPSASPRGIFPFLEAHQDGRPGEVLWGNGGNLLVRREMFERIGGFHEPLRFDLEDFDLCWRAWLQGWKTVYVPEAVVFHRVAASFADPRVAAMRRRSQARNEILVAVRLLPGWLAAMTVTRALVRVAGLVLRLRMGEARMRGGGAVEALLLLPHALAERSQLRRTARISPAALLHRFTRIP